LGKYGNHPGPNSNNALMLEAKNISKYFAGVAALQQVNLQLQSGCVHAIVGENGAGKSTLMKILSGVYNQYSGEIFLNKRLVHFKNTKEAARAGIAIIHQELNLVPELSVVENVFLGREYTNKTGLLRRKKMKEEAGKLFSCLNLSIDPNAKLSSLKLGEQQLVEIAKAISSNAGILIMDEPTSAISDIEVTNLFSVIYQLKQEGKTIVYISHKLNELFAIADHYTVLRDGCMVDAGDMNDITEDQLIQKMTGRPIQKINTADCQFAPTELLSVRNLCLKHKILNHRPLLNSVSFALHRGEILGIYGLMGAGRTALMECLFGLHAKKISGEIKVKGNTCEFNSAANAIAAGIALVPEDRKGQGLNMQGTIRTNISVTVLDQLEQDFLLQTKREKDLSASYMRQMNIAASSDLQSVDQLSGGNQQKIVLAKWLATEPMILLLDEPTRGIDIGAKTELYALMKSLAQSGIGIVIVSSELPEIFAVAHRVMVLCEGEITASLPIESATEENILKFAIPKKESAA
jgi:ribose transport system ATP-binding protein